MATRLRPPWEKESKAPPAGLSSRPPWESNNEAATSGRRPPWEKRSEAPTGGEASGISSSDTSTDFEFLNDSFVRATAGPGSFPRFQELPLELREYIWEFSLPQQRILKVTVVGRTLAETSTLSSEKAQNKDPNRPPYDRENDIGNIVSDASYHLRLRSTSINSPLLYVNREANKVANRVYRVGVPISHELRRKSRGGNLAPYIAGSAPPCLRFCPERDTVLITVERNEDEPYFAHFVHDALAYDPNNKGILHMAIVSGDSPSCMHLPIRLSNLHSRARASLTFTLKSLESVNLIHLFPAKYRLMFSSLQNHFLFNQVRQTEMVRFNRAYPLWSSTASYSILPADPRPISRYLDLVDCGWDPRSLIRAWRMFEEAYNVPPTSTDKMRMLIAMTDANESLEIATTSQARWFRQQEETLASSLWKKWGLFNLHYPDLKNPDTEESLEFSKKQNAIGFWSIPLEAFGPVPEVPYDTHQWQMTRVCDFTPFGSQIQLGVFHIT